MFKKIACLVTLCCAVACSFAQTTLSPLFSRITKKDGLASNVIFNTIQDKKGYIWVGTQNGLHRFDGKHILKFHYLPGDSTSIADNSVIRLFIDKKDRLWLILGNRLGIFNTDNFKFSETKIPGRVNIIKKIYEDEEGKIVLVTDQPKLVSFDEKLKDFSAAYTMPALPEGYRLDNIIADAGSGKYWITSREGILLYDSKSKQVSSPVNNLAGNETLGAFAGIKNTRYPFLASDGSLWLVDWIPFRSTPVLYRYNKAQHQLSKFNDGEEKLTDVYHEIWGIKQQKNGKVWIYGNGLLAYFDEESNRFVSVKSKPYSENDIEFDYISDVYEDREHNVWVSSNKGLYRFNTELRFFSNISNKGLGDTAIDNSTVTAILPTKSNGIWVSSFGGGIKSYNEKWKPIANPFTNSDPANKSLVVVSMMQRRNGEIWIGLHSGVIKIYDPATNITQDFHTSLLEGATVRQILEDKQGDIWIGSYNANLVKCKGGNWRDSTKSLKLIDSSISVVLKIYEDRPGFIWVGTTLDGIYKIDPKTDKAVKHYTAVKPGKNDGLSEGGATDILQYNDSIYLVLSNSICVLNAKTDQFRYITRAQGIPPENGINLIMDKQKWVWVALAGGLYRVNIEKNIFVGYDQSHGIINSDFEVSAATLLNDGRIAMGTSHDFLVFDPLSITDTSKVPAVTISAIRRSGNLISMDSLSGEKMISLPYDNSSIAIEFSTLSYKNQYKYIYTLEGLDNEWKTITEMQLSYPYLPPGDYTLRVKAVNSEGIESGFITSLPIHVRTPFWRSWWFYVLLAMAALGILYWLDRRRVKRKEFIQEMRSNIAGSLHQEVNTTLNNINILSEVARIKADHDIEKSKEYIQQIHSKSQHMIIAMNDMLWSIDPANDNMQRTIDRIQEFIDGLNSQYDTKIELLVDEKVRNTNLNMQARYQTLHIFKECIDQLPMNAGNRYKIDLSLEKDKLSCSIAFSNEQVDLEKFEELINSKPMLERLDSMNGDLTIDTNKSSSLLVLRVPLG